MGQDLGKLTKKQLIEQVESLQAQENSQDVTHAEHLLHELQVHQIELEMQNRELRESQQLLEEARDRYADLYDFAPVSYISFDREGIIKNINLTGAEVLNQVRSNIISQPFSKWVVNGYLGLFFNHLRETLESDLRRSEEIQIKSRHGQVMDIRIESIRGSSLENNAFTCQSVMLDITEQKRSAEEISLKARQLKLITDAMPVLIAYIDRNEAVLFANKTCTDWFGLSPKEIRGRQISELWSANSFRELYQQLKLSFLGKLLSFEVESPFFTDEKKFISIMLIPDYDQENQIQGVIIMAGDITERLMLESVNRKRLMDAAHIARLSTMGEIASEIAHELNQPLAAITIYSDVCQRMIKSEKTKPDLILKTLNSIHQQALRAGEVIRRVRNFASKKGLQLESINIDKIVKEALKLIAIELRTHAVELKLIMTDDNTVVKADKILIEQVVLNLARNAIEAMEVLEEPERLLQIKIFQAKAGEVEVSVEDSGPGMTEDQARQVFDAFSTTKSEGMGLGLTICHSIIEAHHGRIWCVQNEYGGTTFSFTLPVMEETENND